MRKKQGRKKRTVRPSEDAKDRGDVLKRISRSFTYAMQGIYYGFRSKKNIAITLFVAVLLGFLLAWLNVSKIKFTIIIGAWLLVAAAEIINTAFEKLVDTIHPGYSEGVGRAKDMMAGAVFLAIIAATIISVLMISDNIFDRVIGFFMARGA
ncbi:MAG TPA: diacylglycerol kinase [bacterium]|nr:diacylglycerol kinase [bacterium]